MNIITRSIRVVTYGLGTFFNDDLWRDPYRIPYGVPSKPRGGLWACPTNATLNWRHFIENDLAFWGSEYRDWTKGFEFNVTGRILVIDGPDDWRAIPLTKTGEWDFEALINEGIIAIHLTHGGVIESKHVRVNTIDWDIAPKEWDVESVLVLNKNSISNVTPVRWDE